MRALQSLTHSINVTYALKAVINPAACHIDYAIGNIINFARVNKVSHAKLLGKLLFRFV